MNTNLQTLSAPLEALPESERFVKHSIGVTVRRIYTDVDGAILAKASGLIPAALKVKFPFFCFGAFDMAGGYQIGLQNVPPLPGCFYLMSFVNGAGNSSFSVTGTPSALNAIQGQLSVGDIVSVFTDNLSAPSCYVWIIQSFNNVPLAAIIANSRTTQQDKRLGQLFVREFGYIVDQNNQWNEKLSFIIPDNIGDFQADSYQPLTWRTPQTGLTGVLTIKVKFLVDQYIELCSYLQYASDSLQFTFVVEKHNDSAEK